MEPELDVEGEITQLLQAWQLGDDGAAAELWPLVYEELRHLAGSFMNGERDSHTLQPTALVHETYFKLMGQNRVLWRNRRHFFAIAARVMRRILVDHARARAAAKRNSGLELVPLQTAVETSRPLEADLSAVDEALTCLERLHPRQATVVELKFFGGLSMHEIAMVVKCSEKTVQRDWVIARAWLYRELETR